MQGLIAYTTIMRVEMTSILAAPQFALQEEATGKKYSNLNLALLNHQIYDWLSRLVHNDWLLLLDFRQFQLSKINPAKFYF